MSKILLISNGHGEDLSGALLGMQLQENGHTIHSFSFVGKGNEYKKRGIINFGFCQEFSTGGIGYTSFMGRLTELFEGQLMYLVRNFLRLLRLAKNYDLLVIVGDVVPVFAAWLSRRPSVVYLVAYSSHYEGKLRLPWPCKNCLLSRRFLEIYCRDQLTADDLSIQLQRKVLFLGNPFMDPVFTKKARVLPEVNIRLGLLPGSRRPELDNNLNAIMQVLTFLPEEIFTYPNGSIDIALVGSMTKEDLEVLMLKCGWNIRTIGTKSKLIQLFNGNYNVNVYWDSFVEVVQSSDLLLAMAGTAAEQVVGLAKPVVQLPGLGPQFTSSFAEAQRRLLGPTVFCAEKSIRQKGSTSKDTANLIMKLYERVKRDNRLKDECMKQALLRLGKEGGTRRITDSIEDNCLLINNYV
ncbi:lipid-A-disaccharide synthase-related protein [Prochlorococcus marinus]|uniref:Lipid-A-disaccharide synthase n=1 Tax=Prochlorococcus marinus (strain MIT 9211) TaxID=93059 RepID=A9BCX7_PROM4|nr:lipid-A-disaccharide synthase-related protein [Prochlorococcus marinus]ABX08065.1 Conserved hypothetical protein [Prochlorococcus marinus str. MIT 9211]